jgi:Na+/proline symporter
MFSQIASLLLLLSFAVIFGGISYIISFASTRGYTFTKSQYLLADRKMGVVQSSLSIAATWIWAPALFVSSQKAYINGWQGLFWFLVPNVLCLILFSYFAVMIRGKFPNGYTLSNFMKTAHSSRVQTLYWISLIGLAICAFAVQLIAGGSLLKMMTGISFFEATVLLAVIPLTYSMTFGLKASIITDFAKMSIMILCGAILLPIVIYSLGGTTSIIKGLAGVNGKFGDMFTQDGLTLFLTFGLPTTIGLISGPFGDQSFWQRTFATKKEEVKRSFVYAAFIFGVVPLIMGLIGFAAAGSHLSIKDVQMVNIETIFAATGLVGATVFFLIVMSALTSIIDSKLCAVSSIAGDDFATKLDKHFSMPSKVSMVLLVVVAVAIANIPGLKILHLFLFYGTLRSATLIPTVLTLLRDDIPEPGVFYGIIAAILVGLPMFTYGNINGLPLYIVAGSLTTVLTPYLAILATRRINV